jgi:hypothetical protein
MDLISTKIWISIANKIISQSTSNFKESKFRSNIIQDKYPFKKIEIHINSPIKNDFFNQKKKIEF